jgi:hypothetical protein
MQKEMKETGKDVAAVHVSEDERDGDEAAAQQGVRGGFLSFLGVVSYRIRILMYSDVSCMYPKCIL